MFTRFKSVSISSGQKAKNQKQERVAQEFQEDDLPVRNVEVITPKALSGDTAAEDSLRLQLAQAQEEINRLAANESKMKEASPTPLVAEVDVSKAVDALQEKLDQQAQDYVSQIDLLSKKLDAVSLENQRILASSAESAKAYDELKNEPILHLKSLDEAKNEARQLLNVIETASSQSDEAKAAINNVLISLGMSIVMKDDDMCREVQKSSDMLNQIGIEKVLAACQEWVVARLNVGKKADE